MVLVVALFSVSSGKAPLRDKTTNGYKGDLALVLTDKQTNESDKNTVELYTAVSRKVVEKSARDNPERYYGWFWVHCSSKKFKRMAREAMDVRLQVLKESNKK